MPSYQHILVGLDLSPESQQVIDRVKALFSGEDTRITLIHIQEPLSFAYGGDIPMDLGDVQLKMEEQASERLKAIVAELSTSMPTHTFNYKVLIGQPAHEMHRFAKDNDIDLAVVGSHGRHGLALVFGSTANGVLHGACCDVLAVRIKTEK